MKVSGELAQDRRMPPRVSAVKSTTATIATLLGSHQYAVAKTRNKILFSISNSVRKGPGGLG